MSRLRYVMVSVALAAGAVGCAHCNTCDDFPTPCNGPNCGFQGYANAPGMPMGPIVTPPSGPAQPSSPSDALAPGGNAPAGNVPATDAGTVAPAPESSPAMPETNPAPGATDTPPATPGDTNPQL